MRLPMLAAESRHQLSVTADIAPDQFLFADITAHQTCQRIHRFGIILQPHSPGEFVLDRKQCLFIPQRHVRTRAARPSALRSPLAIDSPLLTRLDFLLTNGYDASVKRVKQDM